jgi:hypothetical protein
LISLSRALSFLSSHTQGLDLKDKATIFLSIGELATAVKSFDEFSQYIKPVMAELTQVFVQSTKTGLAATIQSPGLSTVKVRIEAHVIGRAFCSCFVIVFVFVMIRMSNVG